MRCGECEEHDEGDDRGEKRDHLGRDDEKRDRALTRIANLVELGCFPPDHIQRVREHIVPRLHVRVLIVFHAPMMDPRVAGVSTVSPRFEYL